MRAACGAPEANGTQGRLPTWHPGKVQQERKAISAAYPELSCRFAKEASATKPEMLADVDFLDVTVRPRLSCATERHNRREPKCARLWLCPA